MEALTIDELAAETGVPSRTIREYQRLELLPPPQRDGRVGKYGPDHRARLAVIGRLQQRGYSLAAIGDVLSSWERGLGLGSVLGVDANPAVLDETPTELPVDQLEALLPALEAAQAAGLVERVDEATVVVRSLAAIELARLGTDVGMPPEAAVAMVAGIGAGAAAIAADAVDAFVEHLWPRRDEVDVVPLLRRARLLFAQSAASLVVHELGVALADRRELGDLVERVRLGQVRRIS